MERERFVDADKYKVKPKEAVKLSQWKTDYEGDRLNKEIGTALLESGRKELAEVQEKLYAQNRYSILIILQAMDAAGKDSAIKHIMTGFNPIGVNVHSFKTPSAQELDHYYLWRHVLALPPRGEIAIHNRSHYENVLVTRVHPEYILNERIPGIDSVDKIDDKFWKRRMKQINHFEKSLVLNGTIILKFFLHVSKKEQKKRFLERIDDSTKNWKFSLGDIRERDLWDDYQNAYEKALSATSTKYAPWFIVPSDDKWYSRLVIAAAIYQQFQNMHIEYPTLSPKEKDELARGRVHLTSEKEAS
ncbi:polyphosphate kinase 2 family protein [Chryseolinea sp. T2]|uniref:polyphosphate kinase 2 family protein n=1 Tax=Chryseolinea sp. T2 TaxID=3129255 RepID=UPI0030778C20